METDRQIAEDREEMSFFKKLVAAIVIIETIVGLLLTIPSIIIAVELTKISWMMQLYH